MILKVIDSTGKLRVPADVQVRGLDTDTGEQAYNVWGMTRKGDL